MGIVNKPLKFFPKGVRDPRVDLFGLSDDLKLYGIKGKLKEDILRGRIAFVDSRLRAYKAALKKAAKDKGNGHE